MKQQKTTDLKSFHYLENSFIDFSAVDTIKSTNSLDAGTYRLNYLSYPQDRIELKHLTSLESLDIQNFQYKEKIDKIAKEQESLIKNLMDGNASIDNCIIFAATNYIDAIPMPLKNRPSRFKYVLEIGNIQTFEEIHPLVTNMLKGKFTAEEIEEYSMRLRRSSLDEIKQFCMDKLMDLQVVQAKSIPIGFKV